MYVCSLNVCAYTRIQVCTKICTTCSPEFNGSFCSGNAREYDAQLCNTNVSVCCFYFRWACSYLHINFRDVHKDLLVSLINSVQLLIIVRLMVVFTHGKSTQEMVWLYCTHYAYTYVCMHACMCVCMYIHVNACIYVKVHNTTCIACIYVHMLCMQQKFSGIIMQTIL